MYTELWSENTNLYQGMCNLNQKWSEIQIQISGSIRIRIWFSAGSKCCVFITLLSSVISPSVMKTGSQVYEKC